jgi:uracil-DNA glycosylase
MAEVRGKIKQGMGAVWGDRLVIPTYHPTGIRGNPRRKAEFEQDFETIRQVYESFGAASSGP